MEIPENQNSERPGVAVDALVRLYNEYGSSAGNPHASKMDAIMDAAMESVTAYISEHNVCPRDTTGYCIANIEGHLAVYTLRRAFKMKKEKDAHSSLPNA